MALLTVMSSMLGEKKMKELLNIVAIAPAAATNAHSIAPDRPLLAHRAAKEHGSLPLVEVNAGVPLTTIADPFRA